VCSARIPQKESFCGIKDAQKALALYSAILDVCLIFCIGISVLTLS
jgi:hypothetical protein